MQEQNKFKRLWQHWLHPRWRVEHYFPTADLQQLSRKIGLCFSFATEMYPDRDGRPLAFSKEVLLPEVEGELIGANLKLPLKAHGYNDEIGVVLLNDTVAALLGGMGQVGQREIWSFVGFILGTGTNTA